MKGYPSVTCSVTHPRRICLVSDVDFHSERLVTSHLSLGLASGCFGVLMTFGFFNCFSNTIIITVPHRNSPFCHDFYHQMRRAFRMVISHQQPPSTISDMLSLSFDSTTSTTNMSLLYMKNPALCWCVYFPFPVRTVYHTDDLASPMSHTELILILVRLFSFSPTSQVPSCMSIFCCINHSQDPVQITDRV